MRLRLNMGRWNPLVDDHVPLLFQQFWACPEFQTHPRSAWFGIDELTPIFPWAEIGNDLCWGSIGPPRLIHLRCICTVHICMHLSNRAYTCHLFEGIYLHIYSPPRGFERDKLPLLLVLFKDWILKLDHNLSKLGSSHCCPVKASTESQHLKNWDKVCCKLTTTHRHWPWNHGFIRCWLEIGSKRSEQLWSNLA